MKLIDLTNKANKAVVMINTELIQRIEPVFAGTGSVISQQGLPPLNVEETVNEIKDKIRASEAP